MSDKFVDVTPAEETEEPNSLPWKSIWLALATGFAAGGGAYVLSKKLESSDDSETEETPES